jgi:uncharacterized protein
MSDDLDTARRLYAAFEAADGTALLELLSPDFHGQVTDGLPAPWGGPHEGPRNMLTEVWASVFAKLDARPVPDEYLVAEGGDIVVVGHYRGTARETGRELDAAFAHVLRFREGRIAELVQITDSARWREALAP